MGFRRALSSFRAAVLWPLLVAAAVSALLFWALVPRVLEASAAEHLSDALPLLTPLVAERLGSEPEAMQAWLTEHTRGTELRVTVILDDGVVLADSARTWQQVGTMGDHRARPEVARALAGGAGESVRHSETTGLRYVYVARRGASPGGDIFVLRLAQPLRGLAALRSSLFRVIGLAGLLALTAAGLVLAGLNRRLFNPLEQLVEGANRLAQGEAFGHLELPEAEELASVAGSLNRLSDRVGEQIEQIRSERNHLEEILSSMADGILVTGSRGHVIFVNDAFRQFFGVEREVEGLLPLELTRRPEIVSLVTSCLEDHRPWGLERLPLEDGRILAATAAPISTGGVLLVIRDVTERVHLDETRRDFVANVSHEIKTPLTAIRGFAETLKEGALEEAEVAAKFTERILAQCGRLEVLLADLLPLARMESAADHEHEPEPVDLIELIQHAVEIVRPRADKRGIDIDVDLPEAMPEFIGDSEALEQLVLNLLDNSVKYNRDGGTVGIVMQTTGEEVTLVVADTGIGIPAESIPRVFERFYRVDKGRARVEGGTGLGLALVKHAARLHGGRVELHSQLGEGSTFRVYLPLDGSSRRT